MRKYLMVTALTCSMAAPALAGGSDHFGDSSELGYGGMSSRGSAYSGSDHYGSSVGYGDVSGSDVDRYAGYLSGLADGLTSIAGRIVDETVRGGYRMERMVTPESKPKPVPKPPPAKPAAPVDLGGINALPIEIQPPEPPKREMVEMPTIQAPSPEIQPSKAKRDDFSQLENSMRAVERQLRVNNHKELSASQRKLAASLNMQAGAVMGAAAGGKVFGGRLGAVEGAILGGAVAEVKRQLREGKTNFDEIVRDMTTTTPAEMAQAKDRARRSSPEERGRLIDSVRDLTRSNNARERSQNRQDNRRNQR